MSNLIKSVYFNVNPQKVRVIDSDEQIEDFIPNIYDKPEIDKADDFQPLGALPCAEEEQEGEDFSDGLSVISMEEVVSQEREKLTQELQQEQEELLAAARQEADELILKAQEQADEIREEARAEGIALGKEEGMAQAQEELTKLRQELDGEYYTRLQELEEQEKSLEPAFADIVISLVRKMTGIACENKREVVLYLLGNAMKNLEKTKQINIRVSKQDMGRVSAKKSTFKLFAEGAEVIEVYEDPSLGENQCIIETDNKIIDCSLDAQLQNLEEHIKLLVY